MEKLSAREFDQNYLAVQARLEEALKKSGRDPEEITLLAATKTVDADTIRYAVEQGITHIGENRVQEMLGKYDASLTVHRHFIGHLQTNKVKDIIDKVEMIESVSSLHLAKEIEKQAAKRDIVMDVLIEINCGAEESKSGFSPEEAQEAVNGVLQFSHIRLRGLMAIPPFSPNPEDSRRYFQEMKKLFIDIKAKNSDNKNINVLSMGMSGDFDIAVEEGATVVRVGTALFGKRNYQ